MKYVLLSFFLIPATYSFSSYDPFSFSPSLLLYLTCVT